MKPYTVLLVLFLNACAAGDVCGPELRCEFAQNTRPAVSVVRAPDGKLYLEAIKTKE